MSDLGGVSSGRQGNSTQNSDPDPSCEFRPTFPPHPGCQFPADGKTQARATVPSCIACIDLREFLEKKRLLVLRDARPRIDDTDPHLAIAKGCADGDRAPWV